MTNPPNPEPAYCPFCGEELLEGQELSEDHVFGRARGGRVVVTAHKRCNNLSGSGAEGDLQRPNTMINLLKGSKGLPARPVHVTLPSGRRAQFDFTDGSLWAPPTVSQASDETLRIEGTPEQAEETYNTRRARHPEFNLPAFKDLPSEAIRRGSYDKINVGLTDHFRPAEITAVKAALGACVLAYGPSFAVSDFAAALRAFQGAQAPLQEQRGDPGVLDGLDAYISASAARLGLDAAGISRTPRLVPPAGETVHDVILVPVGQRTVLFVHSMSVLVPPYGIVINAAVPQLTPGMPTVAPILLRDGGTRNQLEITDFNQLLMQPALDALILPEEDEDDSPRLET